MAAARTKNEAGILVLVVFLLGVLLGVVGNHLWGARVWGAKTASIKRVPGQFMKEMTDRLDLTLDQQKQLTGIIDDTHAKLSEIYDPVDKERNQIRLDNRARMRAALTPEQQIKFDELLKELGPPPASR